MDMLNDLLVLKEVISKDGIVLTYAKKYEFGDMYPVLDMKFNSRVLKIFERYDRIIRKEINVKLDRLVNKFDLELKNPTNKLEQF